MKASWKLCNFFGIGVYLHFTSLLLFAWVGVLYYFHGLPWYDGAKDIAIVFALFVFILLHELGHAFTAKRLGFRTRDITLFPFGGMVRLDQYPAEPWQEMLVAMAGPAVNFVVATLLFAGLLATAGLSAAAQLRLGSGNILINMILLNVFLAMFNLLPAFPTDGGRFLRAFLAIRMDYPRATMIAVRLGKAFALLFAFLGLWVDPTLVLVAVFMWIGAGEEAILEAESSL